MMKNIQSDIVRAREVAEILTKAFTGSGIFGMTGTLLERPPEEAALLPEGLVFITLTLALDSHRDSKSLWESARLAYRDERTRYLFSPEALSETDPDQIAMDMNNAGLTGKKKDPEIWRRTGISLYRRWGGDPRNFLAMHNGDAMEIMSRMREHMGQRSPDLPPFGERTGLLWLKMLQETGGVQMKNLDKIPLLVDTHIIRATIASGLIYGLYSGEVHPISRKVQQIWSEVAGDTTGTTGTIIPSDLYEPLYTLSKIGCIRKDGKSGKCPCLDDCPINSYCVDGIFSVGSDGILMDTPRDE